MKRRKEERESKRKTLERKRGEKYGREGREER